MSNLNWPEGATHYLQAGEEQTRFRDLSGEQWKYFNSYTGEWVQHYFSSEDLLRRHDLIERPQPKPWSGPEDGLPPVNERVEVLWSSITGEYVDALILAHDEDRAVFRFITGDRKGEYQADKLHFSAKFPNFRAIKKQKQIADEKRETAIREFMDVVGIDCRVTASKAVDAGFKREVV